MDFEILGHKARIKRGVINDKMDHFLLIDGEFIEEYKHHQEDMNGACASEEYGYQQGYPTEDNDEFSLQVKKNV